MRARTANLRRAKAALSQLSYSPSTRGKKLENLLLLPPAPGPSILKNSVGQSGVEPPTLRLSGVRSNQLSYWPNTPK
jgi:hypothetical protein